MSQEWVSLIPIALGGALAIIGGMAATYFTQALNNKAERRRAVREKCEEVYLLVDQVKLWAENEDNMWWQRYLDEFEPDNEFLEMYREEYVSMNCPIDKLMMIVTLHLPVLKTTAERLNEVVKNYQRFDYQFREFQWGAFSGDVKAVLRSEHQKLTESHQELRELIEKTILMSWSKDISEAKIWRKSSKRKVQKGS